MNIASAPEAIVPIGFDIRRIPNGPMPAGSSPNYYVAARMQSGTTMEAANAFVQSRWPSIVRAT